MFEIETVREEKAYRLGYIEAWDIAQLSALALARRVAISPRAIPPSKIYLRMTDYRMGILWPWLMETEPRIGEAPLEFEVS